MNRGSATVEICLIMPIVLFVVTISMGLFINCVMVSDIWSKTYIKMYTYREENFNELDAEKDMKDYLESQDDIFVLNSSAADGVIRVNYLRDNKKSMAGYMHFSNEYQFNREIKKCTSRLRRWQLYGDLLQE